MELDVAYKKGNRVIKSTAWAVSRYNTPAEIMAESHHTMDRLRRQFFGKKSKGDKKVIIRGITSEIHVGFVNRNAI
tara:strand:+ start:1001 stop:1228 length:228 start_codon:yes stop_codon:yes gene_type:complete